MTPDRIADKGTSEVLGRFSFAAAAVDITKSFLGPIYIWAASVPVLAVMRVPILIISILKFFKNVYCDPNMFMTEAREAIISNEAAFKGDAYASADSIGIGGWQGSVEPHSES